MIVTPLIHEPTHKIVWDLRPNSNVFPGLTVWDVHKNENVVLGLTVCDIHTNINVFLGFTVWDVHTYGNDFLGLPCGVYIPMEMIWFRCLARSHTAPTWVLGGPIPYGFWFVWEGPPCRSHSLGDSSKCRHGKGLKSFV